MSLVNRDLVTVDDLSYGEMEAVFSLADEMSDSMAEQLNTCHGKVMACLFFEPSTRTRLSFEAAMHRLGGSVISVSDARASSVAKGESLADTARIVGSYADIIVIRHPWEGAARVVADYADVPVINAGDGGHQHPTQTLCDLYTLKKERKNIHGLKIALWGDLKYGRTIHSLIFALAKFGADMLFCPSPGLEVPDNIIRKLVAEYGGQVERVTTPERTTSGVPFPLDAVYMTPSSPHQLAMMPDVNIAVRLGKGVDALYVTRPQKERFVTTEEEQGLEGKYPVVDKQLLKGKRFERALVMHPLPRVDELAYDVDADPRSMYFKQAARGVPIRMALIALLLGARESPATVEEDVSAPTPEYPVYQRDYGARCPNPACVSTKESEAKYLKSEFRIVSREPLTLRCVYCEHGFQPEYIASSDWHEGRLDAKRYHRADSYWAKKIRPENLIVFGSVGDAEANGFKPGRHEGKKKARK
ncbi:MAG TPA: aspartate carbamoyltransferase [Dehalococcoidia bacterium]|nr:aspartate carbamoyltransferase [Dehalococcoidia bacterium]